MSLYERGHCDSERVLLSLRMREGVVDVYRELRKGRFAKRIIRTDSATSQCSDLNEVDEVRTK